MNLKIAPFDSQRLLAEAKANWSDGRARKASQIVRFVLLEDNSGSLFDSSWASFSEANRFDKLSLSEQRLLNQFVATINPKGAFLNSLSDKVAFAHAYFNGHADLEHTKDGSSQVETDQIPEGKVIIKGTSQDIDTDIKNAAISIAAKSQKFVGAILKPKTGSLASGEYANSVIGNGFMVAARLLNEDWNGDVFVSCAHVVKVASNIFPNASLASEISICFFKNDNKSTQLFRITNLVWADNNKPPNGPQNGPEFLEALDVAIFRLDAELDAGDALAVASNSAPYSLVFPLAFSPPGENAVPTLAMPLTQNRLLYREEPHLGYSCTTVAGNSGCPVFNEHGDLVGIHTGNPANRIPSKDQGINHAFSISAIRAAIVARPLP
jgi:Trypsin-like peptidase domain